MIYNQQFYQDKHRVVSDHQARTVKSPVRVIRVSTSPTRIYPTSSSKLQYKKPSTQIYQPYQHQPIVQQSANKLKYLAKSPLKPLISQTVYITSPSKVPTSPPHKSIPLAPTKPLTLRERLWAKNKSEPVEQYNIWEGYESETSIPQALSPREMKSSEMLSSNSSWNFSKKSIISKLSPETMNQSETHRIQRIDQRHFDRKPLVLYK